MHFAPPLDLHGGVESSVGVRLEDARDLGGRGPRGLLARAVPGQGHDGDGSGGGKTTDEDPTQPPPTVVRKLLAPTVTYDMHRINTEKHLFRTVCQVSKIQFAEGKCGKENLPF